MADYKAEITIMPKEGVLDTQGKAVEKVLKDHEYAQTRDVRVGRFVRLYLEADNHDAAAEQVKSMCRDILVNDLIESWQMTLEVLS